MSVARGYRVALEGPSGMSEFLSGVRSSSLRVFGRRYGALLADEVARRVDLHRAGVEVRDPGASPVREAVEHARGLFAAGGRRAEAAGLDLRLRLFPLERDLLVRVDEAHEDYLAEISALPGVRDGSLPASGPAGGATTAEWTELEAMWALATAGPPLGVGLSYRLVEHTLPSLRFQALRRHFPLREVRVRRTARAALFARKAGVPVPADAAQARDFRRYLETATGKGLLEQEERRVARLVPEAFDKDDVASYARQPPPDAAARAPRVAPAPAPGESPRPIDHADVIESGDGRVFVAVMDAGLAEDERVHIQVVERHLSFIQNGVHYGGVSDCPLDAVDLLRESREAIIVEMRRGAGRQEIKARHVALVRDDGREDIYAAGMAGFRRAAERNRLVRAKGLE